MTRFLRFTDDEGITVFLRTDRIGLIDGIPADAEDEDYVIRIFLPDEHKCAYSKAYGKIGDYLKELARIEASLNSNHAESI